MNRGTIFFEREFRLCKKDAEPELPRLFIYLIYPAYSLLNFPRGADRKRTTACRGKYKLLAVCPVKDI